MFGSRKALSKKCIFIFYFKKIKGKLWTCRFYVYPYSKAILFFFFQSLIFFKSELSLIFIYFKNDYKIRNKTLIRDFLFLKKQHMFTKIKFRGCQVTY